MGRTRIWHWMVAVAASGLMLAVARIESDLLKPALVSLVIGLCFIVGLIGAWRKGRPTLDALWYVAILGPFGVVFGWSEYPLAREGEAPAEPGMPRGLSWGASSRVVRAKGPGRREPRLPGNGRQSGPQGKMA